MVAVWKELGFRSYDAYIKSRLWWSIRQIVLERDGKCCQVCGTPSKIVHHIDYTKIVMLGQGDQHELITLCEPCHTFVEQHKRVPEKKTLLNKLFCQHSKNTLDEWQVWAKQFNSDIQYNLERLFEHKHKTKKKQKTKKKSVFDQPEIVIETKKEKSAVENIRDQIDAYIKQHKKKKQKSSGYNCNHYINKYKREQHCKTLVPATEESKKQFITDTVRRYNRKSAKNIKRYLDNHKPLVELLFNHPEANDKLKNIITKHPYFIQELRKNETAEQKRQRKEEQYQKQRDKKKAKLIGKLPAWTINHKAQSLQGKCPLRKHLNKVKEKRIQEPPLDKPIPLV